MLKGILAEEQWLPVYSENICMQSNLTYSECTGKKAKEAETVVQNIAKDLTGKCDSNSV